MVHGVQGPRQTVEVLVEDDGGGVLVGLKSTASPSRNVVRWSAAHLRSVAIGAATIVAAADATFSRVLAGLLWGWTRVRDRVGGAATTDTGRQSLAEVGQEIVPTGDTKTEWNRPRCRRRGEEPGVTAPSGCRGSGCVQELVEGGRVEGLLAQKACGSTLEEVRGKICLRMGGEQDDDDVGVMSEDPSGGFDAVDAGQSDVHQDQLGP
jgi:hypothetical protein